MRHEVLPYLQGKPNELLNLLTPKIDSWLSYLLRHRRHSQDDLKDIRQEAICQLLEDVITLPEDEEELDKKVKKVVSKASYQIVKQRKKFLLLY